MRFTAKVKPKAVQPQFKALRLGDVFRYTPGGPPLQRIEPCSKGTIDKLLNTIAIETGFLYHTDPEDQVYPVNGAFIEE